MRWQATSHLDAQKALAKAMGCRYSGEGLRVAAIAECLRSASMLCSAPIDGGKVWEPAASLSLTTIVRRRLNPLWPDLSYDEDIRPGVLSILKSLGVLGDLTQVNGNLWLPSPAIAIRASHGAAVVIGGGPSQAFPKHVVVRSTGRARLIDEESCQDWIDLWAAAEWIGAPEEGLAAWASRLLGEAQARLAWAPAELHELVIYGNRRWHSPDSSSDEHGLQLGRWKAGPAWNYFIGRFARGRLVKFAHITNEQSRRYRFYLDLSSNCPIYVNAETAPGLVKIRLPRPLPQEEAKSLLLGWEIPRSPGEHPGATSHVLPIETLPIVQCALEGLGVVLNYGTKGRI